MGDVSGSHNNHLGIAAGAHFFDRNGGERIFSFGTHADFRVKCRKPRSRRPEATPLAPLPGQHQAQIGMETLLKFEAFGRELNPIRVYLVLKTPDAAAR